MKKIRITIEKTSDSYSAYAENVEGIYAAGDSVVETKQSDIAKTAINGIYRKGKWYLAKTFVPDRNGWDIPNRYKV